MLVWFAEEPKSLTIPFSDVKNLNSIPSDGGLGARCNFQTTSGVRYLMAYNYAGTQQQSLLLSALLAVNIEGNTDQNLRISIKNLRRTRKENQVLVVGSIQDENALLPTGAIIEDKLLHSSAVGEEIGDGIPEKSTEHCRAHLWNLRSKKNMSRFRGCYQKALGQIPDLQGAVQIQFSVDKEGRVSGARVSSSTLKCACRTLYPSKHLRIEVSPEPQGGTAIFNYPFTFTRRE